MALHGSATIELTNADGGKQIVKHDNIVTNAANELLACYNGGKPVILESQSIKNERYIDRIFGGIMLFNKALNNKPEEYAIDTTKITGYASQDAYNGTDTARGSANLAESGLQEDGSYKLVYDFTTSQANGQIQSLGLCPNIMGQIGASDETDSSYFKDFYLYGNNSFLLDNSGYTEGVSNYNFRIAAVIGNIAYAVNYTNLFNKNTSEHILKNGGVVRLYKFRLTISSIGVGSLINKPTYIGYDDVQLPSDFINTLSTLYNRNTVSYYFDVDNKKLIVFPCAIKSTVNINGTVMYCEIDLANNMTVTTRTFTNTTAGALYDNSSAVGFRQTYCSCHTLYILKNHIIVVAYVSSVGKARMYVIDKTDNAKVLEAKIGGVPFDMFSSYSDWKCTFSPVFVSDNIFVFARQIDGSYNTEVYILDLATGEMKKTNAKRVYVEAMVSFGNVATVLTCDNYLKGMFAINPFILTTKNNLDAPVVKTASQTMKITYTLTESEGA